MSTHTKKSFLRRWWWLILIMLLLHQCSYYSLPSFGRVVDLETGEPIEGVWVTKTWRGSRSALVQAFSTDYQTIITKTNKNGYYYLHGWYCFIPDPLFSGGSSKTIHFKVGYRFPNSSDYTAHRRRWTERISFPPPLYFIRKSPLERHQEFLSYNQEQKEMRQKESFYAEYNQNLENFYAEQRAHGCPND